MINNKRLALNSARQQQAVTQLLKQGRSDEALKKIRAHLLLSPNDRWFLHEAARLMRRSGQFAQAERDFRRLLKIAPNDAGALNGLGLTCYESQRFAEAEQCYQQALALLPDYAACRNNYAILLHITDRHHQAIEQYQLALAAQPDYPDARFGYATALAHMQRLEEAEQAVSQALESRTEDSRMLNTLGMIQLRRGNFAAGWRHYQQRYAPANPERFFLRPALPQPWWQGEDLAGKSILVLREQGFGDEIQFCRYVARLKSEKHAAQVMLACSPALVGLMTTLPGVDHIVSSKEVSAPPVTDVVCMLLDLPAYFLDTPSPFGPLPPYLHATTGDIAAWPLPQNSRKTLRVGLVWKGSVGHNNDRHRSLSHLAALAPLLQVEGIQWISLQKGAGEEEALTAAEHQSLLAVGHQFTDYAQTAAVMAQLDLVISVDTSVAHLAGALGINCWLIVPGISTDWRWTAGREDSLWYPQMRLFQRGAGEEEAQVVARIQQALQPLLAALR